MKEGDKEANKAVNLLDEELARISKKKRIMLKLLYAYQTKTWLYVNDFDSIASRGYIYSLLNKLLAKKLIIKKAKHIKRIIGNIKQTVSQTGYQGTKKLESFVSLLEEGGLPTGAVETVSEEYEMEVATRSLNEILDTARMKFEVRQVGVRLDPFQTKTLRQTCSKPKKGDRGKQRKYATKSFSITIPNSGNAFITLKDWKDWEEDLLDWCLNAGLSKSGAYSIVKQIRNQMGEGWTRAEIPILEQSMKRLQVRCNVDTVLKKHGEVYAEVSSNINYSLNEIGLEYFGTTRFVDALLRVLIGLQQSTVVSEAARDQYIEDAFEALDKIRKEREALAEEERKKEESEKYRSELI